jgi:hypothetical protein
MGADVAAEFEKSGYCMFRQKLVIGSGDGSDVDDGE